MDGLSVGVDELDVDTDGGGVDRVEGEVGRCGAIASISR